MSFSRPSWRHALTMFSEAMLSDDRFGDLVALLFALLLTVVTIALLPI